MGKDGELPINIIPSEKKPRDKRLDQIQYKLPPHPANICILGRCGSGKSCCLYSMLKDGYVDSKKKSVFDEIVVYLGTMDAVGAFEGLPCKNVAVLHEFDPESFMTYIDELKKHQMERLEKGKPALNVCIVFDDFAGKALMKPYNKQGSPLEHLLLTSRHECNATIMYCSQVYKNNGFSTPTARNNITHWIIYQMGKNEMEKIAEEHAGLMSKEEFLEFYNNAMKKKHNFVMINYKVPEEERYTERFTEVYRPTSQKNALLNNRRAEKDTELSDTDSD
jgi:GTPase SAR1 family protein